MPTGAMPLMESMKTTPRSVERGIISTYALAYHPMSVLPMIPERSGTHAWNLENEIPYTTGGTRNVNGAWSATRSSVSPFTENVRIYGGRTQIDRMIVASNPGKVVQERESQMKSKARRFTIDMFEGAGGSALRGLDSWIDNEAVFASQNVAVGSVSTGAALTTDYIDQGLEKLNIIPGRTFIYCTPNVNLRIRKLSRGANVSGDTSFQARFTPEQIGFFSGMWDNIPVIELKDGKGTSLLSTTLGDGSSSNMYAITYGTENYTGFQIQNPSVIPLSQADVYNYFDFEHYVGTAPKSFRCIVRWQYITDSQ